MGKVEEKDMQPLILISNDDGVQADGIQALAAGLLAQADVVIVAPDRPRSGVGCGVTLYDPLRYTVLSREPGLTVCSCSGTPVDCVKLALEEVVERRPDLIVGGINHGDNSSVSVHYSGTMGIVLEGCMKGIPSVGFSLCDDSAEADFSAALPYVRSMTARILRDGLPAGVCLNVNFPRHTGGGYAGVRVCRMIRGLWSNECFKAQHPRGGHYFWLTGAFSPAEPAAPDTDVWALEHNYVAVTPVQVDMTAYDAIQALKPWEDL